MLILDIKKYRGLNYNRKFSLSLYSAHMLGAGLFFGIENLLVFMIIYRINMTLSWFTFSYLLHTRPIYDPNFSQKLPKPIVALVELLMGSGGATALLYHSFHHTHQNQFIEVLPIIPRPTKEKVFHLDRRDFAHGL